MTKNFREYLEEESEKEIERILKMSDKEIIKYHLKQYGGNKNLADRAIEMLKRDIDKIIQKYFPTKH